MDYKFIKYALVFIMCFTSLEARTKHASQDTKKTASQAMQRGLKNAGAKPVKNTQKLQSSLVQKLAALRAAEINLDQLREEQISGMEVLIQKSNHKQGQEVVKQLMIEHRSALSNFAKQQKVKGINKLLTKQTKARVAIKAAIKKEKNVKKQPALQQKLHDLREKQIGDLASLLRKAGHDVGDKLAIELTTQHRNALASYIKQQKIKGAHALLNEHAGQRKKLNQQINQLNTRIDAINKKMGNQSSKDNY